jgi:hypothetical protein
MSVRGILISLAINFAVAGTVWYLKGPNAGLVCLAIGLGLFVVALFWPKKKPEPQPPPQSLPPIHIENRLENIGNPVNTQDNRQAAISLSQPPAPPKPEPNIKFLGVRPVKVSFAANVPLQLCSFHEQADGKIDCVVACFRNEAIYGKTVKPIYDARAHLKLFDASGAEIGNGIARSFWLGRTHDTIDLVPNGESGCVMLLLRDDGKISIPAKTRHTSSNGYDTIGESYQDLREPPFRIEICLLGTEHQPLSAPLQVELTDEQTLSYKLI